MKWLALLLFVVLPLGGCITETTGGSEVEADPASTLTRRVELARQYVGRGDWENAKRNLELATLIDSNNAEVYEAFALVYQSTGEYELAEKNFKQALRVDSDFSRARNNYAAFLFFLGRFSDAEPEFERVTHDSLYSGRPLAFINLGLCRLRLENNVGAEAAFSRALRMDRSNPLALFEMGFLKVQAGNIKAADSYYGIYRTVVSPQPPRGLILGLEIALASGDQNAVSSYELALNNLYANSPEYQRYLQDRFTPVDQ